MPFRPAAEPLTPPAPERLTADMAGIGMRFAVTPSVCPPIEETLVHASDVGMVADDLRVLAILVTWLEAHVAHVHVDRLTRLVLAHPQAPVRAFWAAVAQWRSADRRFQRLARLHRRPRVDVLRVGTAWQVQRAGEDPRFATTCLRVPANLLRDRPSDILSPAELVAQHPGYRNRVLMGPSWRADVWTALQANPSLTAAEAARRVGCAFATAWTTRRDFRLLAGAA